MFIFPGYNPFPFAWTFNALALPLIFLFCLSFVQIELPPRGQGRRWGVSASGSTLMPTLF